MIVNDAAQCCITNQNCIFSFIELVGWGHSGKLLHSRNHTFSHTHTYYHQPIQSYTHTGHTLTCSFVWLDIICRSVRFFVGFIVEKLYAFGHHTSIKQQGMKHKTVVKRMQTWWLAYFGHINLLDFIDLRDVLELILRLS